MLQLFPCGYLAIGQGRVTLLGRPANASMRTGAAPEWIAATVGVSPAQVTLRWPVQQDIPIVFSALNAT